MNAVVQFQAPRLPFHPAVEERFGIDKTSWKALVEAVFPAAESIDSVVMALAYCKARNLDPFKRPVHIVPVWDSKRRQMVETVWPGVSELRTTAMRTGLYAGKDRTDFGPDITETLGDLQITYPEWAQVTVYRVVPGAGRVAFEGPQVYWRESYATAKRDTLAPNAMWRKRPRGQLDKCAEAGALRTAFPEELGNEYTAEEMAGKEMGGLNAVDVTPRGKERRLHAGFDEPEHDPVTGEVPDAEFTDTNSEPAPVAESEVGEALELAPPWSDDEFPGDRPQEPVEAHESVQDDEVPTFLFESPSAFSEAAPGYLKRLDRREDLDDLWKQWGPDLRRLRTEDQAAAARVVQAKKAAEARLGTA